MFQPPDYPGRIRTDTGSAFVIDTMHRRIPETIQKIRDRNPDYSPLIDSELVRLSQQIKGGAPIAMLDPLAPDYADWLPAYEAHKGMTWLSTDWFFAETYFYRQVMACVRWFETRRDPFLSIKREEYESDAHWEMLTAALKISGDRETRLHEMIARALWGNRIDLSFAPSLQHGTNTNDDDLLVDARPEAVQQLIIGQGPVHIIVDNAGTELTMDFALVDLLLDGITDRVVLHLKAHPTFVSDATVDDVWRFFRLLRARGEQFSALGTRLESAFEAGRLLLAPHPFWNSSLSMWEMPGNMASMLRSARLIIVKGDANHRRLLGDAIWPTTTPFAAVTGYLPVPVLTLRVMKSDPVVGLPEGMAEHLDSMDAGWRVNGKRGTIQYKG